MRRLPEGSSSTVSYSHFICSDGLIDRIIDKSQRFPEAIDVIPKVNSTLDSAGSTPPNITESLASFLSLAQEREPASTTLSALMSLSDPCLSPQQLIHDARVVGLQERFSDYIIRNPIREEYEALGKNVPSRELVNSLRGLCKSLYVGQGRAIEY